jgi:hypothetical protein
VFLGRVVYAGELGDRIRVALMSDDRDAAVEDLGVLEHMLVDDDELVTELHSALLGIYLGYRERKAYQRMVDMYPKMPPELQATPVAQEQLAFALNRLAEASDELTRGAAGVGDGTDERENRAQARQLRSAAVAVLERMDESVITAETWGIWGRIYKGWYDAEKVAGNEIRATAMLARAIEAYENGVKADMRDYFPGVNAVTLRSVRAKPEDLDALEQLVPVVRMAVDNAPPARSEQERYWQTATKLELASAARDWEAANDHLLSAMGLDVYDWMHETTVKNLRIHREAFHGDSDAVAALDTLIEALLA